MPRKNRSYFSFVLTIVLSVVFGFALYFSIGEPTQATPQVLAQGGSCGQPCVPSNPGSCGTAPSGYSVTCQAVYNRTTNQNGVCVCTQVPTPQPTNVVPTRPAQLPTVSTTQPQPTDDGCVAKCDRNGDGAVTEDDITLISSTEPELATSCRQSCVIGSPITPSPADTGNVVGDCSGAENPGTPDGKVDLLDIEQYRKELNKEVSSMACDFDKDSDVDIIDFTNYLRIAFIRG